MTKEDTKELSNRLREKGLTCNGLDKRIKQQMKDALDFQRLGFMRLSNTEKNIANQLKSLRDKVCRRL